MILDKLLEKKDLEIYILLRIKNLRKIDLTKFPKSKREKIAERIKGKISELKKLRLIIKQVKLKEMDKMYWEESTKLNGEELN